MNGFALSVEDVVSDKNEPQIAFILKRGDEVVLRRQARVFSEDDVIAVSDEMTGFGKLDQADVDQYMAELIEPIRIKWLRDRDLKADGGVAEGPQAAMPRYVAVLP